VGTMHWTKLIPRKIQKRIAHTFLMSSFIESELKGLLFRWEDDKAFVEYECQLVRAQYKKKDDPPVTQPA
jgi:hypothetical protein